VTSRDDEQKQPIIESIREYCGCVMSADMSVSELCLIEALVERAHEYGYRRGQDSKR
jgi:hypothetical protein